MRTPRTRTETGSKRVARARRFLHAPVTKRASRGSRSRGRCEKANVWIGLHIDGLTNWFPVDASGTRQGAVLSPFLFSLLISPLVDELQALGMGTSFGHLRIGCLMFADDIVLIADSERELQSMMNIATVFFRKWRFQVSAGKTRVVSLGHRETRVLRPRSWHIGGKVVRDFASYTYLGIKFDKSGNWLNMLNRCTEKCRSSMGHLHSMIEEDTLALPVTAGC